MNLCHIWQIINAWMFRCIFPLKHTQLPASQGPHPRNMCRPAPLSQPSFSWPRSIKNTKGTALVLSSLYCEQFRLSAWYCGDSVGNSYQSQLKPGVWLSKRGGISLRHMDVVDLPAKIWKSITLLHNIESECNLTFLTLTVQSIITQKHSLTPLHNLNSICCIPLFNT